MNPFFEPLKMPHLIIPFDRFLPEHFEPALKKGIEDAKKNLEAIKENSEPPTFENTIKKLETSFDLMTYVTEVFFNLLHAETSPDLQKLAPKISAMAAEISSDLNLDPKIFARVKAVFESPEQKKLSLEEKQVLEKTYKGFVRNGALLDAEKQTRLRAIDQEMASLAPQFGENVLKATQEYTLTLSTQDELKGLPASLIETLKSMAKSRNQEGYLVTLDAPIYVPFMTFSENREARKKLWSVFNSRAFKGNHDNREVLLKTIQLRHERAQLLGYKTHAHYTLAERMAESPEKVMSFLEELRKVTYPKAKEEVKAVEDIQFEMTGIRDLQPWDFGFFSERLKERKFQINQEELKPYFPLQQVLEGIFSLAKKLYHLHFEERKDIPVYHPEVRVFEVTDTKSNQYIGLFYADFFPRPTKRGGAWCTGWIDQGLYNNQIVRPRTGIVCNFTRPTETKPSLLTFDEARTLFHEFGHALHHLLSQCTYPSVSGTHVYWDFVELPSQFMENWLLETEVLNLFAKHYETGEVIPKSLVEKLKASSKFNAATSYLRQLSFGFLDMAWHTTESVEKIDIETFEEKATATTRFLPKIPGTNISCAFAHVFAGGYSAGYYSYKWAEVLEADAFEFFKTNGLFDPKIAHSFRTHILEKGGTEHPMTLYKKFRGREPDSSALLRRDGLM